MLDLSVSTYLCRRRLVGIACLGWSWLPRSCIRLVGAGTLLRTALLPWVVLASVLLVSMWRLPSVWLLASVCFLPSVLLLTSVSLLASVLLLLLLYVLLASVSLACADNRKHLDGGFSQESTKPGESIRTQHASLSQYSKWVMVQQSQSQCKLLKIHMILVGR